VRVNEMLKCPFCKGEKFVRTMEEIVTMNDEGETIIDEVEDCISVTYRCLNCGREITEEELEK